MGFNTNPVISLNKCKEAYDFAYLQKKYENKEFLMVHVLVSIVLVHYIIVRVCYYFGICSIIEFSTCFL